MSRNFTRVFVVLLLLFPVAPAVSLAAQPADPARAYADLTAQATKLNEEVLRAQEDLVQRRAELDRATATVAAAQQIERQAKRDEDDFQGQVDLIAQASFEGARFNQLSALLVADSQQDFLNRLEMMRVLGPHGVLYLNVPSNGAFHRYPVDCWRFYPDSGRALARWGQRNGLDCLLLESYTSAQQQDLWNDFVCVMLRDAASLPLYPRRIMDGIEAYSNGLRHPHLDRFLNPQDLTEDQRLLETELARRGAADPGRRGNL